MRQSAKVVRVRLRVRIIVSLRVSVWVRISVRVRFLQPHLINECEVREVHAQIWDHRRVDRLDSGAHGGKILLTIRQSFALVPDNGRLLVGHDALMGW